MIFNLWRSCKDRTEFLYTLRPFFSNAKSLPYNNAIIKTKTLTFVHYLTKLYSFFKLHLFFINDLDLFRDPILDTTLHSVIVFPLSPPICDTFSVFWVLTTWMVLKSTGHAFYRCWK